MKKSFLKLSRESKKLAGDCVPHSYTVQYPEMFVMLSSAEYSQCVEVIEMRAAAELNHLKSV